MIFILIGKLNKFLPLSFSIGARLISDLKNKDVKAFL